MSKLRLTVFSAILFLIFSTSSSQCYQLFWSEEFDYTGPPSANTWNFEVGGNGGGNNELQYYTDNDPDNAWVENGYLTITAIKEDFQGKEYTSARINTTAKFEFTYGKVEARIKLPYGQGIWPAFWLMGDYDAFGWPACGEIDIMEMIGGADGDNVVYGTPHWDYYGTHAEYGGSYTLSEGIFADDYHIFAVEWDANSIRWFVDGTQFHVMTITDPTLSEYHANFHILLNLAVGGNWPGSPDGTTQFPQSMEVDYVRVYKSLEDMEIAGPKFISKNDTSLLFTIPGLEETSYFWTIPENTTVVSGQGTDSLIINWGNSFQDISVLVENRCGSKTYTKKVFQTGQYPYPDPLTPHAIPGTINATEYDYGGEGVAYHDVSVENEGDGIRQDDRVDTQNTDNGTANIGWVLSGEWLEYTIDVKQSGYYNVSFRVATDYASGGPFALDVNGEERLGSITVPGTGGWGNFITIRPGYLALYDTDTLLKVRINIGNFNLGNMSFTPAEVGNQQSEIGEEFQIYPNPTIDQIRIVSRAKYLSYKIIDVNGRIVKEGIPDQKDNNLIDVSQLKTGIYIVAFTTESGIIQTARFNKTN